ncbi:Protein of unknown function [Pyronema omphalodes CBS 100304]|uniref:Uncharacterized protein n=1 Tax=Pyronema omphalodes (strain CBS 100304) TaxID=1076935 RepID=U4L8Q8_PYROM|nr:Protein of unknown function [Pyronema omphalodes CBS 100304]
MVHRHHPENSHSPSMQPHSGQHNAEPQDTAVPANPPQNSSPVTLNAMQEGERSTQKQLPAASEHPMSAPHMEALIQQHQEENNRIKYELTAAKEHSKFTLEAEKKIGKLKEQKAGLKKEVSFLHEKGMHLQN